MTLTAHQPVYLPWLGLFHKIALADTFVSFNQVQYLPKDWNNRNRIKTHQGPIWLTVPVLTKGYLEKRLCDIEIHNVLPWRRQHWRSLQAAYGRTSYFKKYADFFEDVYQRDWKFLCDLNDYILKGLLRMLAINVKFLTASDYEFKGAKSDLVLDMCRQLGAQTYVFGTNGKDYADVNSFDQGGIRVLFQEYRHPIYQQPYGEFVSHLSVLDLLFSHGESSLEILMSGNLTRSDVSMGT